MYIYYGEEIFLNPISCEHAFIFFPLFQGRDVFTDGERKKNTNIKAFHIRGANQDNNKQMEHF